MSGQRTANVVMPRAVTDGTLTTQLVFTRLLSFLDTQGR